MNVLPIIKSVVGLASSLGAGAVVGNAIKATTPADLNRVQKVIVGVGSVAISSVAGNLAATYIEDQLQQVADNFKLRHGGVPSDLAAAAEEAGEANAKLFKTAGKKVKETVVETIDPDATDDTTKI